MTRQVKEDCLCYSSNYFLISFTFFPFVCILLFKNFLVLQSFEWFFKIEIENFYSQILQVISFFSNSFEKIYDSHYILLNH